MRLYVWPFNISSQFTRIFLLGISLTFCLLVLIRYQIINEFSLLQGDRYDAVIVVNILEHWFDVFSGVSSWTEVNYFYPYTKTIAQTDAYFLVGVAYLPFRLLGLDPFISVELSNLLIKSCGFIGAYLLSRKVFSLSFYWALLVAVLFTLSNGMTIHGQRIQLATVAFTPILALLIWNTIKSFIDDNMARFRKSGIFAGVFFGAWCLTCFYAAWFFLFFTSVFLAILLIYTRSGPVKFSLLKKRFIANYGSVVLVVSCAFLSLIPFIYVFLAKSLEVGVRSYGSVLRQTVSLEGILQVGNDNFLFGPLYNHILSYISPDYYPQGEYYNTGFTLVLFFLFICGCFYFMRQSCKSSTVILKALVLTSLFTWILTLKLGGYSAWFFVYHLFPGAKALNVVAAYQIFLAFPVIVIAVKYLSIQQMPRTIIGLIVGLLIMGEFNKPYLNLERQVELDRVLLPYAPPETCRVFYVSGIEEQNHLIGESHNLYAHNVIAMRVAQITKIPTINGIASFNPPDSNFSHPNRPDYESRVHAYAQKHNITELCRLDLNSKKWSMEAISSVNPNIIEFNSP
jgi:hypothetical protein